MNFDFDNVRHFPMFFYMHFPKAAGISIINVLSRVFAERLLRYEDLFWANGNNITSTYHAITRDRSFFAKFDMVTGHMSRNEPPIALCPRERIFLAVFRDPVSRVVSMYDYIRREPDHPLYRDLRFTSLRFALRNHDEFREASSNAQLKQVFLTTDAEKIHDLLNVLNILLGKLEYLDDFMYNLSGILDKKLEKPSTLNERHNFSYALPAIEQDDYAMAVEDIISLNYVEHQFLGSLGTTFASGLAFRLLRERYGRSWR
jgi:hypothetical protein